MNTRLAAKWKGRLREVFASISAFSWFSLFACMSHMLQGSRKKIQLSENLRWVILWSCSFQWPLSRQTCLAGIMRSVVISTCFVISIPLCAHCGLARLKLLSATIRSSRIALLSPHSSQKTTCLESNFKAAMYPLEISAALQHLEMLFW